MYQGKPKLKKITQVNLNNPTLNSFNMRGIFFEPVPPQIVRDQLLYHPGFKDALQQTVQQQQKRHRQSITPKQSYSLDRQTPTNKDYEPLRKRYGKNEVLDKITQLPAQQTFDSSLNYRGYQSTQCITQRQRTSSCTDSTQSATFDYYTFVRLSQIIKLPSLLTQLYLILLHNIYSHKQSNKQSIMLGTIILQQIDHFLDLNISIVIMEIQSEYLIQSHEAQVELKKNYMKIFNLLPAPNHTYVFLGMSRVGSFAIVHVDKAGKIIFEHRFEKIVDSIALISETEVLALQPKLNHLLKLDLITHQIVRIPFQFLNDQNDQCKILTFSKSKYICVLQNGRYNDNRLKLSYFTSPLDVKSVPFTVYETNEEWNYQYHDKKGNEQSMVLWYKPRNDEEIELKVHHLQDKTSKFNIYKIKNNIGASYGENISLQLSIINAWEVEPSKFCLVCVTQKTELGFKNSDGKVNNNFIWDTAKGELRQTNFWFDQMYNDYLIDISNLGDISVFHTFYFQNGLPETSPVYYVHNKTQKIVARDSWRCSYRSKNEYPIIQNMIVQGQYQNQNISSFKVTTKILRNSTK